jgi:hypothetical protein
MRVQYFSQLNMFPDKPRTQPACYERYIPVRDTNNGQKGQLFRGLARKNAVADHRINFAIR